MKDIRQSSEYANYMKSQGWIVEVINKDFVYIKRIFLVSLLKYQRPDKPDLNLLAKIAKKYKSIFIIYEPKNLSGENFKKHGYKQTSPYLPSKTISLNLNKSKKKLYEEMDKDARYAIRKTQKSEVKFQKDIQVFQNSWKKAAANGRYILSLGQLKSFKRCFGENMILITNSTNTSGAMFIVANNVGYYWYGFTSDSARATLIQYKIIFDGILWAKSRGAKFFDFEGIYDSRFPNKAWIGFSIFKKKFGGNIQEFPGAYSKWRLPF